MNPDTLKRRALEALAGKIKSQLPNTYLFQPRGSVQGFFGTSQVMLVAERPSTAEGPVSGAAKSLLYPLLEETGNANAHLADLIKTRGKRGEPYPENIAPHRHFFDREIEIVRPHLIVLSHQKVYDLLLFHLAGRGIKIRKVWHYAYARYASRQEAFKKQLREALKQ
jgi:uracil-DNA glycosylase